MKNSVGVIIPTFNRKESLRGVLGCLRAQQLVSVQLKVIVVVDGSSDGTLDMLEEDFPEVSVVKGNGNWWYTKSINEGMRLALANHVDYILTLNDDVFFEPRYITNFLEAYAAIGTDAVLGSASFTRLAPHRVTFSGIRKICGWRLKEVSYISKFTAIDTFQLKGLRPSVNLSGRGMFFGSSLVKTLGLLDERFPQYGSDTDFSYSAFKKGIPVMVTYDSIIFENEKFTSKGALYNKPGFGEYLISLFNPYSVNSLTKSVNYYNKHGNKLLMPFYFIATILGSLYVFLFKYRNR